VSATNIIIIVSLIAIIAILGLRAGREHGTTIEHLPSPDDRKDID
jgi:hypothetical protein